MASQAQTYADVNKYLNKQLAKGVIGIGDIPEFLLNIASWPDRKVRQLISGKEVPGFDFGVSTKVKKLIKERIGADLDEPWRGGPSQGDLADALVRSTGHGAEFLGSSLIPFTGGAKYAKQAMGLGAGSGALQEVGVPQAYADLGVIGAGLAGPAAYKAGARRMKGEKAVAQQLAGAIGEQNVPKVVSNIDQGLAQQFPPGFKPLTAGLAENPELAAITRGRQGLTGEHRLSQQEMANRDAVMGAVEGLRPEGANLEQTKKTIRQEKSKKFEKFEKNKERTLNRRLNKYEEALDELPSHSEAGLEAGDKIRKALKKNVEELSSEQYKATNDRYNALKKQDARIQPNETRSFITDEFGIARGKKGKFGTQLSKDLESRKNEYFPGEDYGDVLEQIRERHPDIASDFEKILGNPLEKTPPTAGELIETRFNLNKKLSSSSDKAERGYIKKAISHLDADIERAAPEISKELKEVNKIYGDYATQINQIERHPAMGKALAFDRKAKQYKAYQQQIAEQFVKGKYSKEAARSLKEQVGDNKPLMESVQQNINKAVLENIINPQSGRVDPRKLENFRRNYEGAFELYPALDTKLKNVENANLFLKNAEKRYADYSKNLNENVASDLLNENVRNVPNRLLASDNPITDIKNIKKTLAEDKTGKAWEGFQGLMADDLLSKTKLSSGDLSFTKFSKYLENHKAALTEVFAPEQVKLLEQVEAAMKTKNAVSILGKEVGSATAPKILNALKEKQPTVLSEIIGSKGFGDLAKIETLLNPKKGLSALGINLIERHRLKNMRDVMDRALTDPTFAKLLLTDPKNKSAIKNAINDVNESFKASRAPLAAMPKDQESKENPLDQEEWMYEEEIPIEEDY